MKKINVSSSIRDTVPEVADANLPDDLKALFMQAQDVADPQGAALAVSVLQNTYRTTKSLNDPLWLTVESLLIRLGVDIESQPPLPNPSKVISIVDLATLTGKTERTIRSWLRTGKIRNRKVGGSYIICLDDIGYGREQTPKSEEILQSTLKPKRK